MRFWRGLTQKNDQKKFLYSNPFAFAEKFRLAHKKKTRSLTDKYVNGFSMPLDSIFELFSINIHWNLIETNHRLLGENRRHLMESIGKCPFRQHRKWSQEYVTNR